MSMHALGGAHASGPDPVRLLDELKRIAVEQLGAVPGGLYQPLEDQLQRRLKAVDPADADRQDLTAVLVLRQRSASLVMRYRELIARNFDEFLGRPVVSRSGVPLGLVADGELGFHLAGQHMAEAISQRYLRPLEMLDLRFEVLAKMLDAPAATNPVGATRLAGAFLRTFHDSDLSEALQLMLFQQYEIELSKVLGDLYARINHQLSAHGIHADRSSDFPARPVPQNIQAPGVQASVAETVTQSTAGSDVFRISAEARVQHQRLRDLLHVWRGGAASEASMPTPRPAAPAAVEQVAPEPAPLPRAAAVRSAVARRELRPQELVSVAALMQRESAWVFEAVLGGTGQLNAAIRHQLLDGARSLGLDPEHTCIGEHEEDAIDLVGLMFESLLDTHALLEPGRKLLARLVMSYVRIALTDENLFVRPDHPGRRLLDALTLSCESNDGGSPQDRELLQRAGQAVARVTAEFNEDLAIFELAANELQDLLQQQRRRAEVVERRSAETVHGRERLLQARLQAAAALSQRMSARPLTPVVSQFLEIHWQHHLIQMLLRDGQGSARCGHVLALADALVGIDEAAARCEGGRVAERAWQLRPEMVECLASSGLDEQVAVEWMAGLARAIAFPDSPRDVRPLAAMPQLADEGEDTRLLQVVGGHAALDFDPVIARRMATLAPGSWMRLVDETGEEGSAKVAWVSPLTSRLLLVNRRGVRKLVASPQQLAALVKAGKLMDEAAELPFDEAMRHVRSRLAQVAQAA